LPFDGAADDEMVAAPAVIGTLSVTGSVRPKSLEVNAVTLPANPSCSVRVETPGGTDSIPSGDWHAIRGGLTHAWSLVCVKVVTANLAKKDLSPHPEPPLAVLRLPASMSLATICNCCASDELKAVPTGGVIRVGNGVVQ
jgi:hypothetical protein